ncbi:aminomethyltransferase [Microbacterium mangrovi]|uniref:Aminomethyltransferase n=1 Tax=Microbacterium mangrovi TaxID=1348253 RepID=A0A0B2A3U0_9MICO|nr:folate-binding protein YgfZ [Microbacterium mangrovi]KHK96228.1 aminomethyltransferase [Microbacterium mangrovi]
MNHDFLTTLPGAVVEDDVLQHLGNPVAEQRSLAAGTALAVLGDRAVIAVPGEDRLSWLDSVSSQALTNLAPGESTELLILDPQGHVEHAAGVVDDGETTWLIADAADAEGLLAWLRRMRFRLRVDPRDASDEFAIVAGTRAAIAGVPAAAVWHDPWPGVTAGGWAYGSGAPERDWAEALVPVASLESVVSAAQGIAGAVAADALRVAAWRPRMADVDERTLPHEMDWLRTAVHLNKGCYRGQETVAKVHNLGHPPRRLVALQLDGVVPARGDAVRRDDAEVGTVVASALHFEEGPIALALLRRSVPVDAALAVATADGDVAAAQEVIVPPDAGATADVPRMPRLGRRAS